MAKEIILADWLMKKLPPAERFHEILRFLIVGGGCFLLEYVLLYMLTEFAPTHFNRLFRQPAGLSLLRLHVTP